jgi:hypothetical protein
MAETTSRVAMAEAKEDLDQMGFGTEFEAEAGEVSLNSASA